MNVFQCDTFLCVRAESMTAAAEKFALHQAQRENGVKGSVRTLTLNNLAEDGSFGEFTAFIGSRRGSEFVGRDFFFTVRRK